MKYIIKYKKALIAGMLILILAAFSLFLANAVYGDYSDINLAFGEFIQPDGLIYLKIGEEYDLKDLIAENRDKIDTLKLRKMDGGFFLSVRNSSAITLNGTKVKATGSGVGTAYYLYSYTSRYVKTYNGSSTAGNSIYIFSVNFAVIADEANYVDVYNIEDITKENNTYILRNDITISNEYAQEYYLYMFTGALLNPGGYKISIEESSKIKYLFRYNFGLIDNLKLQANIASDTVFTVFGLFGQNQGVIMNSELTADIEGIKASLSLGTAYNCVLKGNINILAGEESGYHFYLWGISEDNTVTITISGETSGIEERDEILDGNNTYKVIIEEISPEE